MSKPCKYTCTEIQKAYQQGKQEAILHQCNHDLAVKEAYKQGRDDAYNHAMTILNGLDTELAELFSDIWLDEIKEANNGNTSN